MNINERIERIINFYGFNKNNFSMQLGLTNNTTIGNIVGGRQSRPSYAILERIKNTFPEINMNWLFTGRGRMLMEQPEEMSEMLRRQSTNQGREKASFELILDEFSIDELITYIHRYEKDREFNKNETYRMFIELQMQRRIIEQKEKNDTGNS